MKIQQMLRLATMPVLAFALTACGKKAPSQMPTTSASAATSTAMPFNVDADSWAAEWRSDKVAFNQKYAGQPIELTGEVERTVDGVVMHTRSGIFFKVQDKTKADLVQAFTSHDLIPVLRRLKVGDKVTVACTGKENLLYPTCDGATIVR